jgi:hypothetical protein
VLFVFLFVSAAVPAAAGTIVGTFSFQRDICDPDIDFFCDPPFRFEYFTLQNDVELLPVEFLELTFSGSVRVEIGPFEDRYDFFDPLLAIGEGTKSELLRSQPFVFTLDLTIEDPVRYPGTLEAKNFAYDPPPGGGLAPTFTAEVVYTAKAVTDAPSWLVVAIALGALAGGRSFLT